MPQRPAVIDLPLNIRSLLSRQAGVVSCKQMLGDGLTYEAQRSLVRAKVLERPAPGTLCLPGTDELSRRLAGVALTSDAPARAAFGTAAILLGWREPWPRQVVDIWMPASAKRHQRRPGVRLHWTDLAAHEVQGAYPIEWTSGPRTAWDVLRRWPRDEAIALLDAALNRRLLEPSVLAELETLLSAVRRPWLKLIDRRSESWLETMVRLFLLDHDLHPEPQVPLLDRGREIARFDLAWRKLRVAIECDGEGPHSLPGAVFRDRHRDDDTTHHGWRVLRVTWSDLRDRPQDLLRRVRRALALAA